MTSLTCHDTSTPFLARVVKTTRRAISKFSQHHKQVRPNASQTTTPTQCLQKAPAQRTTDKTSVYYYLRCRLARRLQLIGLSRYVLLLAGSEVVAGDCPCWSGEVPLSRSECLRLRERRKQLFAHEAAARSCRRHGYAEHPCSGYLVAQHDGSEAMGTLRIREPRRFLVLLRARDHLSDSTS